MPCPLHGQCLSLDSYLGWDIISPRRDYISARFILSFDMLDILTIVFFSVTGKLATMKHGVDDISQAKRETECGLSFEKFTDIQEGDVIQCCTVTVKEQEIDWDWGF